MDITPQQQAWVGRQRERARQLLDLCDAIERDLELYDALDYGGTLTDDALATGDGSVNYLTQSDIWNAVTVQKAFVALLNAHGLDELGKQVADTPDALRLSLIKFQR